MTGIARKWFCSFSWTAILFTFILLFNTVGCESSDNNDEGGSSGTNYIRSSGYGAPDQSVEGSLTEAKLAIENHAPYIIWSSLDDRHAGGSISKLHSLEAGESGVYVIPAGLHWLAVYSYESDYKYQDAVWFDFTAGKSFIFQFDGNSLSQK